MPLAKINEDTSVPVNNYITDRAQLETRNRIKYIMLIQMFAVDFWNTNVHCVVFYK